jgi:hypothetical protein
VDQRLVYRALRFDIERRTWFRRAVFLASMSALALLLFCLVFQLPFQVAVAVMFVFVALHLAQMIVPHWWTRRVVRQCQRSGKWPVKQGETYVDVELRVLRLRWESGSRSWPLENVADAFYLGDMLLICPEPGVLIPVPRTADFGGDSFVTFCRVLAVRLTADEQRSKSSGRRADK